MAVAEPGTQERSLWLDKEKKQISYRNSSAVPHHTHTHTHTHTHIHTHTPHSHTHTPTLTLTHTQTHSHTCLCLFAFFFLFILKKKTQFPDFKITFSLFSLINEGKPTEIFF
jgi:hypothetical protein